MPLLGRSQSPFSFYAHFLAKLALFFGEIPTELDAEQLQYYLFYLQKMSKTPSQTNFKHTVYGSLFLPKGEGFIHDYQPLPEIM